MKECTPKSRGVMDGQQRLTLIAKKRVNPMDPKYAAVKGSRGAEIRWWTYVTGPMRTAHDAKNRAEPMDHL